MYRRFPFAYDGPTRLTTPRLQSVLLAETLRHHQRGASLLLEDVDARDHALRHDSDACRQLLRWVQCLAVTPRLRTALQRLRLGLIIALLVPVLIGLVAGASSAGVALGNPTAGPTNLLALFATLIALPTIFLLLWLMVTLVTWRRVSGRPRDGHVGWMGDGLITVAAALASLSPASSAEREDRRAAIRAVIAVAGSSPLGRWGFGLASHGAWLAFALGAMLVCAIRLTGEQHDFVWGTTLLSDTQAMGVIHALAWLPGLLHLPAPTPEMVAAARMGTETVGSDRQIWGRFLMIMLILYTAVPRLLLTLLCAARTGWLARTLTLDLGHSLYQRALLELRRRPREPDAPPPADALHRLGVSTAARRFGPGEYIAVLGLELDDVERWPPPVEHWQGIALLHIASRAGAREALAELAALRPAPRFAVVMASMVRSPDRGAMELLADVANAARAPILLLLLDGERLERRGEDRAQRLQDWADRARRAGVQGVRECTWADLPALNRQAMEVAMAGPEDPPPHE